MIDDKIVIARNFFILCQTTRRMTGKAANDEENKDEREQRERKKERDIERERERERESSQKRK
jgi:hypothetical protein